MRKFYKYHGAGNDFIMIDNRDKSFTNTSKAYLHFLCDRHFGIGADGLILLEKEEGVDFKMVYYNSDGSESTMCGNGGRCIVAFARDLSIIRSNASFIAIDGKHEALIRKDWIELKMIDVEGVKNVGRDFFLDTGSPHHVSIVESKEALDTLDVKSAGEAIRNSDLYKKEGTNVNFISFEDAFISVRTYERGVEDETLACGTGVTAVALLAEHLGKSTGKNFSSIKTLNAELEVSYDLISNDRFRNVWLKGPAVRVFEGQIKV